MIRFKTLKSYTLYTLLFAFCLTSCKKTYYSYEIEKICKECKDKGGVSRFTNDLDDIIIYCNDGSKKRLN